MRILVIEDDRNISFALKRFLSGYGHEVTCCFRLAEAYQYNPNRQDFIILDLNLPDGDGFEYLAYARSSEIRIPFLIITVRYQERDIIRGLEMGADDYLTKPFEMLELLARVEAVLRRTQKTASCFEAGNVKIDFSSHQVFHNGQLVECTPKEYELLEVLVNNRNIALSREKLLELVWGYDFEGDTRTVDVHIQKLRKKLGWEDRIKTVYKLGYRLEVGR